MHVTQTISLFTIIASYIYYWRVLYIDTIGTSSNKKELIVLHYHIVFQVLRIIVLLFCILFIVFVLVTRLLSPVSINILNFPERFNISFFTFLIYDIPMVLVGCILVSITTYFILYVCTSDKLYEIHKDYYKMVTFTINLIGTLLTCLWYAFKNAM